MFLFLVRGLLLFVNVKSDKFLFKKKYYKWFIVVVYVFSVLNKFEENIKIGWGWKDGLVDKVFVE